MCCFQSGTSLLGAIVVAIRRTEAPMLLNRDKSYLTDSSASPITVMITSFLRGGIVVCNRILIVHANGQPNPTSRCDLFFTNKKVNHKNGRASGRERGAS